MPQLDISTYIPQVFWGSIVFALMLGVFIGLILPKISDVMQKRENTLTLVDSKIKFLEQQNHDLSLVYSEKKNAAIEKIQRETNEALQKIRQAHEKRIATLDAEMYQELQDIIHEFEGQTKNFDVVYESLIKDGVEQVLTKIGTSNGR